MIFFLVASVELPRTSVWMEIHGILAWTPVAYDELNFEMSNAVGEDAPGLVGVV